ncbi:uncharacterized protein [Nicotiana sylvestris]|uniref:uncharacterized protein n=1 Tax=Nicotiana sylvestris TaxID=4096 RepID=UPI00388CB8BB
MGSSHNSEETQQQQRRAAAAMDDDEVGRNRSIGQLQHGRSHGSNEGSDSEEEARAGVCDRSHGEVVVHDVIGEIVNFSEVQTQNQGGIFRKFMDIELEDDERKKLSTTFWGEFVDEIVPHLLSANNQPVIVVMQLIKAHKYQYSYSVRNTWNASKLWINKIFPQSDEFKIRLLYVRDNNSERLTQTISQQSYPVSDELEKGIVQVKTIGQLVESMQVHVGLSQVLKILNLKKDGRTLAARSVKRRYKLQVRVMDTTGSVSLLLWDRETIFLIGKSAKELKEGFLENTGAVDKYPYSVELNNILQRKFMFKVIIKTEDIHQQKEVYSVVKLTDEEQLINKYSPAQPSDDLTEPDFNNIQVLDGEKECELSSYSGQLVLKGSHMDEQGHVQITPTTSAQIQRRGQRRKIRRRNIYSYNASDSKPEIIRNVPRAIQNKLRDRRAERREKEKKFRELRPALDLHIANYELMRDALIDAIDKIILYDWEALSILVDSLGQSLGSILTDIYHEVWPSGPFWVYVLKFEAEWENRLYDYL